MLRRKKQPDNDADRQERAREVEKVRKEIRKIKSQADELQAAVMEALGIEEEAFE